MTEELTTYEKARRLVCKAESLPGGAFTALMSVIGAIEARDEEETIKTIEADLNAHDGLEIFCGQYPDVRALHAQIQDIFA